MGERGQTYVRSPNNEDITVRKCDKKSSQTIGSPMV